MIFKGMQKTSFIDFPGQPATVLFTGGCNFRCSYCHNSELVKNEGTVIHEKDAIAYLVERKKYINALCISGGEPTLHPELYDFIKKIKGHNFKVKLDTNGTKPEVLKRILDQGLVDYIAMDIKAPLEKYELITQTPVKTEDIVRSIQRIKHSGIAYEFRTTICDELLSIQEILDIVKSLDRPKQYTLQNFRDSGTILGGENKLHPFKEKDLEKLKMNLELMTEKLTIRL